MKPGTRTGPHGLGMSVRCRRGTVLFWRAEEGYYAYLGGALVGPEKSSMAAARAVGALDAVEVTDGQRYILRTVEAREGRLAARGLYRRWFGTLLGFHAALAGGA